MSKVKTIPPMRQFYDKYFSNADLSTHSVTTLGGLRVVPIHSELFVNCCTEDDTGAPFIKGEFGYFMPDFGYFMPDDVIVNKNVSDIDKAIITFVTCDFRLVLITVCTTTEHNHICITASTGTVDKRAWINVDKDSPEVLLARIRCIASLS